MGGAKSIACLMALLLAGCSGTRHIVVGSKNFTEQNLLGEILARHLERRLKVAVDRKLNLSGTLLAHEALATGQIDLYPEYTGTALTAILKLPPSADHAQVLAQVREEYRRRWKLEWIAPLGFGNTFAMAVRGDTARAGGIATLSDAARRREGWLLGAGYEFTQRADGLEGLVRAYGLRLREPPVSMDLGLLYQALQNKQVDMVAANSTDGLLSVLDVVVLRDDKDYFPPYECAVVVRQATLDAFPGLRAALEELSGRLSEAAMRRLNHSIDGKRRPLREVADEFLDGLPRR